MTWRRHAQDGSITDVAINSTFVTHRASSTMATMIASVSDG
jgi:hypothetical protein